MRRLAPILAAAAAAALAVAAAVPAGAQMPGMGGHGSMGAPAAGAHVSIAFAAFVLPRLDTVRGQTVTWTNISARAHDIVATDQSYDSGRMPAGDVFSHRFDQPGTYNYYCSLHPFMTGEVDVHDIVLDQPGVHGGSGLPFVLTGRVAAGTTGSIRIEGNDGSGFRPAGTAAPGPDGAFRATVTPSTTTSYRAQIANGADASPAVQVFVLDHKVAVTRTQRGGATTVAVRVTPAAPGQRVVLQLRLRDRFGWWPVASARLDHHSTARFVVRRRGVVPARVLLTLADGATELARSVTVRAGGAGRG